MTPKEHAEIWRRAAQIVGGMDTMTSEMRAMSQIASAAGQGTYGFSSRSYSAEEVTANRAYSAAARVLLTIAAEYEKQDA